MAYLSAVVIVGRYFQKRRALAQGLSTKGTGFGMFLMTVLLKYLCAEYGWRNAMLIQGAVSLNLCLWDPHEAPPSWEKPKRPRSERSAHPAAHSTEYVMSNGQQGRTEEKDGGSGNEETLCDLQAQECPDQAGSWALSGSEECQLAHHESQEWL
ncbi:hypothetical protein H8958_003968 [Nasalis larvatus]